VPSDSCNPSNPNGCSNYCKSNSLIAASHCWNPNNPDRILNNRSYSFAAQAAYACASNPFMSGPAVQLQESTPEDGLAKGIGLGVLYGSLTVVFAVFLNYRNHGGKVSICGMKKCFKDNVEKINGRKRNKESKSDKNAPLNLDEYEEVVQIPVVR
jgi:hypothetical protein